MKYAGVLIALVCGAAAVAGAPTQYRVTHIVPPDADATLDLQGLDDRGQVLMNIQFPTTGWRAFLWTAQSGFRMLSPEYSTAVSYARDLNNLGQVTGRLNLGGPMQSVDAVVWEADGTLTYILQNAGGTVEPRRVSDSGVVYAYVDDDQQGGPGQSVSLHSWTMESGLTQIPVPSGAHGLYLFGVNDSGVAAGSRFSGEYPYENRAGVIEDNIWHELPTPDGFTDSTAFDINSSGMVLGIAWDDSDSVTHNIVWMPDGSVLELGTEYELRVLNENGQAAGWSHLGPEIVVWSLQDRLQTIDYYPFNGFSHGGDIWLNNEGQILVEGWPDDIGYLLTPNPCPGDAMDDLRVDLDDLQSVLASFGTHVPVGTGADLAGLDGYVNIDDLNAVLSAWGRECTE